jgi:TonB family protein
MTMAMQAVQSRPSGPKVLRIAVIQGGKIIEERIQRRRESVHVGSSEKNHFVIHGEGVPSRFELFQVTGDDYVLNYTDSMSGRVGSAGTVHELQQARNSGVARHVEGTGRARAPSEYWQIKLNDGSRGKVVVGATTLLFQFVHPPTVQPRPQLPVTARAGFLRSIDWLFTSLVAFTFVTMFGLVVYLENADWPLPASVASVPEDVAHLIFQEPPPPAEKPRQVEQAPTDQQSARKADAKTSQKSAEPQQPAPAGPERTAQETPAGERSARIAQEAAQAAETLIVGALSAGTGGALSDVLAGGAVTGRAADILSQAAGVGVAQGSSGGSLRTRSGSSQGSGQKGLGSLSRRGDAEATTSRSEGQQVVEREIRGQADLGTGGDIGGAGEFDASIVVRMIKTRIGAIRACYERELKRNPTLAGKVTIQFTIELQGNVSAVRVVENTTRDEAVGSCVANAVQRFRFNPGPQGGSVSFSYPFVFAPQK